ncbi:hypothetical protein CPB86DRAFT_789136 [Serendipita vermifera]|nr:hypothetical protein CPB86DRAFT_789136 [Serendipita vermifera]
MGMIQTKQGILINRQMLFFGDEQLKEFGRLQDYGMSEGDSIYLEVKLGKLEAYRRKAKIWASRKIAILNLTNPTQVDEPLRR